MPHSNMEGATGGNDKVFCSKPARGWSHSDKVITNEGVTFNVRVSLEINLENGRAEAYAILFIAISIHFSTLDA